MLAFIEEWSAKLGVKIVCSQETEPMGTAGPLALAREKLDDGSGKPFFVLNSDVVCEYPLKDMLDFHTSSGGEATILVTKVDDPSKYGVVVTDGEGKVERFVEKPQVFVGDKINAGIYVINPSVLNRIELRPTSIEKEVRARFTKEAQSAAAAAAAAGRAMGGIWVFPHVATDGKLFAFTLPGYWMDVGQPKDYLLGLNLHLASLRSSRPADLASGAGISGNVLVAPSAKIGSGSLIGPDVSIGEGCVIGEGVRLSNCVIMRGVKIKNHAKVDRSIIGWDSQIGAWSRLEGHSILGKDVQIKDELFLNGATVLPHKEIKESVLQPTIIL
ncbi:hypothetical protein MNEG_12160 [Monoraphidium neglectum]|uniref:mannose-1-phosphate guanylyltransferase n=1 Tax=Monoraphidium neglectum TaxID=145388 RepID=A0A0D2KJ02_9CHLO|nr:hypothetical protein MNEG_12160 [Monoraphidium neglectum]KIY95803.1 hypothetical protein MNEG_12160 [Monoraphidium neglectum]|eukprot:XP_013894823.1 hypothetical protein MNEG_12160 [Monoraphidium neglectum]